MKERHSFL